MAKTVTPKVSQIVRPAPKQTSQRTSQSMLKQPMRSPAPPWAPGWFYSALAWLGKTYYDASTTAQSFNDYLAGSDVDPYVNIGLTRLFLIVRFRDSFRLSMAADVNSTALLSEGALYPVSDEGIRDMYLALSANAVFPRVKYCYVPGRLGSDL